MGVPSPACCIELNSTATDAQLQLVTTWNQSAQNSIHPPQAATLKQRRPVAGQRTCTVRPSSAIVSASCRPSSCACSSSAYERWPGGDVGAVGGREGGREADVCNGAVGPLLQSSDNWVPQAHLAGHRKEHFFEGCQPQLHICHAQCALVGLQDRRRGRQGAAAWCRGMMCAMPAQVRSGTAALPHVHIRCCGYAPFGQLGLPLGCSVQPCLQPCLACLDVGEQGGQADLMLVGHQEVHIVQALIDCKAGSQQGTLRQVCDRGSTSEWTGKCT